MKKEDTIQVSVAGSKSVINRLLTIASYADHTVTIENGSSCQDVQTMLTGLAACGMDACGDSPITLSGALRSGSVEVQDAGTAYRFLLARVASEPGFVGDVIPSAQLSRRPIQPLIAALQAQGAHIRAAEDGFYVEGTRLSGGTLSVDAGISSQFISALLMVAPSYRQDLHLRLTGKAVSLSYIAMTIALMKQCGVVVDEVEDGFVVASGQSYLVPDVLWAEPDYSSAAYFWALGALIPCTVETTSQRGRFLPSSSLHPDAGFLALMAAMGAEVHKTSQGIMVTKKYLAGINVDMGSMPDQVPTLAVLALCASCPTVIRGIAHLRHKESDRIEALVTELSALGADISYTRGTLKIHPLAAVPAPTLLHVHNDHRLAMAFGVLAARYPQISIDNRECVQKSYPGFWREMNRIH